MATINIERASAGRLWVRLGDFTSEDVTRLKGILGRRWHPEKKMWSVPDEPGMAERLSALFAGEDTTLEPPARIAMRPSRGDSSLKDPAVGACSILQQLGEELQLRGYSPRTRQV
ncbi:MAG: hypothetical protein KGJ80_11940, partial [Chloroflexota bacterium]|nr:hypothetical protein [Chloroflexota bacterium]